uniref:IPT/TIG domain-containing protein n=1 Tax=Macrostomum lignano TaxID=282301 RepID=A0A1I8JGC5_9PLAT
WLSVLASFLSRALHPILHPFLFIRINIPRLGPAPLCLFFLFSSCRVCNLACLIVSFYKYRSKISIPSIIYEESERESRSKQGLKLITVLGAGTGREASFLANASGSISSSTVCSQVMTITSCNATQLSIDEPVPRPVHIEACPTKKMRVSIDGNNNLINIVFE